VEGNVYNCKKILQNLINTGKVVSFINNVIVEIEEKNASERLEK